MTTSVIKYQAPALDKVRILVVGDVMLDRYWFGDVNRISPEAPAGLLGVVGNDEAGNEVEHLLHSGGIHSYLKRDEAISTIIKLRVIGHQQQMLRIDFEEPPSDAVLHNKLMQYKALLADYDVIILSDYAKGSLVNLGGGVGGPPPRGRQGCHGRPERR
jgi:bifunctional ADP-heptose synthase (sugar kinase/adenylyltransferase)